MRMSFLVAYAFVLNSTMRTSFLYFFLFFREKVLVFFLSSAHLLLQKTIIKKMKYGSFQGKNQNLGVPSPMDQSNYTQAHKQNWVPKKLNWTSVLYDQNIFIDSQLYRRWDRNLHGDDQSLIDKDLSRTRSNEQYFTKTSTRQLLKRITTFYCYSNKIQYQQGLLEVVIPFALLHRKDFETRKCYAYFNAFMTKYFPRVLIQKTLGNKNQLPHAILAITLCQILLRYHQKTIYQIFKSQEIPLSMVITQQLMTVFARNVEIPLVYEIFNYYINKKDKNYLLYLAVALISLKKKEIIKNNQEDTLHMYVNKHLKTLKDKDDLEMWFHRAEEIEAETPKSFVLLTKKIGFCDRSFFTFEDYQRMMKLQNWLIDYIMPIYREQIDENPSSYIFILINGETPSKNYHYIRLSITESEGTIIYDQDSVRNVSQEKIFVIGYTQENEEEEKKKLGKLIRQIDIMSNFKYRFMMFQDKLKTRRLCDIY